MQRISAFLMKHERKLFVVSSAALICLIALCFAVPAQSQIIKIPFLGITCLGGLYTIWKTKGSNISKTVAVWFALFLLYNLIWSVLGFVNRQVAASDYFRLGVVWTTVFFFVVACISEKNIKWIFYAVIGCLCLETVGVLLILGYGFQLWPNVIKPIFPTAAIGIHIGYTHISAHFTGGMAFAAPIVYCLFVMGKERGIWKKVLLFALWFVVVFAVVATSRRILLLILPVTCVAVVIAACCMEAAKRKRYVFRALIGGVMTGVYMLASIGIVSTVSTNFLRDNYDSLIAVIQNRYEYDGDIKYLEGIVFDPLGYNGDEILLPTDPIETEPTETEPTETEPTETEPTETEPTETEPFETDPSETEPSITEPDKQNQGFLARIQRLAAHLQKGTPRGEQMISVLENWPKAFWFGVGFGAELPGYPWNDGSALYEMEFVVRVYSSGLIGILWLLAQLAFLGIYGIRLLIRKKWTGGYLAPMLVGYLAALIATLSNPYIFSGFDYLLMLFLPVAFLNCAETSVENQQAA